MAMLPAQPDMGEFALRTMSESIVRHVRQDLKQRVMAVIEPELDSAIEVAVMSLKPKIEAYLARNYAQGLTEYVVRVTLEKETPK